MNIRNEKIESETGVTEITIQPDGRIYVQGLSRGVLEVIQSLNPEDQRLIRLRERITVPEIESPHVP
ncbi:MAG TPA: hypothetical protein VH518_24590 [Tepidisphaeraceae bacterium]|jgi:hypothetical protein